MAKQSAKDRLRQSGLLANLSPNARIVLESIEFDPQISNAQLIRETGLSSSSVDRATAELSSFEPLPGWHIAERQRRRNNSSIWVLNFTPAQGLFGRASGIQTLPAHREDLSGDESTNPTGDVSQSPAGFDKHRPWGFSTDAESRNPTGDVSRNTAGGVSEPQNLRFSSENSANTTRGVSHHDHDHDHLKDDDDHDHDHDHDARARSLIVSAFAQDGDKRQLLGRLKIQGKAFEEFLADDRVTSGMLGEIIARIEAQQRRNRLGQSPPIKSVGAYAASAIRTAMASAPSILKSANPPKPSEGVRRRAFLQSLAALEAKS